MSWENGPWTVARVVLLKKLWADGLSASQVAAELGGVTRSGVIGKVHRLGLVGRKLRTAVARKREATPRKPRTGGGFNIERTRKQTDTRTSEQREADAEAMRERFACETVSDLTPEQRERTVTLFGLTPATCRWPLGDPGKADFGFCGAAPAPEKPYCSHHWRVGHV